jgi:MoaA/NifB/PqqE/SkfB family radical SAM enzyme
LSKVYFFNYGDPFVNRQAEAMLAYLRRRCPDVDVETSTNAIPLSNLDRATAVVQAEPVWSSHSAG